MNALSSPGIAFWNIYSIVDSLVIYDIRPIFLGGHKWFWEICWKWTQWNYFGYCKSEIHNWRLRLRRSEEALLITSFVRQAVFDSPFLCAALLLKYLRVKATTKFASWIRYKRVSWKSLKKVLFCNATKFCVTDCRPFLLLWGTQKINCCRKLNYKDISIDFKNLRLGLVFLFR